MWRLVICVLAQKWSRIRFTAPAGVTLRLLHSVMASPISSRDAPYRTGIQKAKRARSEGEGDDADPEMKRVSKAARLDASETSTFAESADSDLKLFAVEGLPGADVFYIPNV